MGRLSLDGPTRDYIDANLSYRLTFTVDAKEVRDVERHIRQVGLIGQLPLLDALACGRARSVPDAAATNGEPKRDAGNRHAAGATEALVEPVL